MIQEEEVMIHIWELENCYVKDIIAKFERPVPSYTTVASIMKDLERKKHVRAQRVENMYLHAPAIKESKYKQGFMNGVVRGYFENPYKKVVSFFAKDQRTSISGLKEIIDMIEKGKEN